MLPEDAPWHWLMPLQLSLTCRSRRYVILHITQHIVMLIALRLRKVTLKGKAPTIGTKPNMHSKGVSSQWSKSCHRRHL